VLEVEVYKLLGNVDTVLEKFEQRLQGVEEEMLSFVGGDRECISNVIELVEENDNVTKELKEAMKQKAYQEIVWFALLCDGTNDFKLEGTELDNFVLRLGLIEEIDFDPDDVKRALEERGGEIGALIEIVKKQLHDIDDDHHRVHDNDDNDGKVQRSLGEVKFRLRKVEEYASTRRSVHGDMMCTDWGEDETNRCQYEKLVKGVSEQDFVTGRNESKSKNEKEEEGNETEDEVKKRNSEVLNSMLNLL